MVDRDKSTHPFRVIMRDFRKRSGMSMYQVGEKTGRKSSFMSQIENSNTEPRISTVLWYAEAVGVAAEEMLIAMVKAMQLKPPDDS